ncbi:hypothetical protein ScPMuIL_006852 [Solemya velum]
MPPSRRGSPSFSRGGSIGSRGSSSLSSGSTNYYDSSFFARDKNELEYIFVKPLDKKFECTLCHNVLRYPVQFEECGHRCCASCLPEILRVAPRCPVDQKSIDRNRQVNVDKRFQEEIDQLEVKCSNCMRGCLWRDQLKQLKGHLPDCQYHLISCPKKCGAKFEKVFLKRHLLDDCGKKETKCDFCEETILQDDEYEHLQVCCRFALPCPNECKIGEIPREEMGDHLVYECVEQEIPCPFYESGCEYKSERKCMQIHISDDPIQHLGLACDTIVRQKRELEIQAREIHTLQEKIKTLRNDVDNIGKLYGSQLLWRIDAWAEKVQEATLGKKQTFFSPPFLTARHGYKMVMTICPYGDGKARGKFLSVFICVCRGEFDALLSWPFNLDVSITLIDQCQDPAARRNTTFTIKPNTCKDNKVFLGRPVGERNASFGAQRFLELEKVNSLDYVRDNVVFIKCSIDSQDMLFL